MRDLTLESLPADERARVDSHVRSLADSFIFYDSQMSDAVALADAEELVSRILIKMGPQQ